MTDTIAAIATATGGGVGIVRISGPRAESILRALCPSLPRTLASHKLVLARVRAGDEVLDEVLAVVMRAPRSYTGEDVAELHGHGGSANLKRLLDAALGHGARLATPGEFTRRAFTAGKLDLTQAEAVAALIGARDERTLRAAHALREGALGTKVDAARRTLVYELADIEGALDFPDETVDDEAVPLEVRATRLGTLSADLATLAARFRRPLGLVPEVVLVGAVNAGKSSLLNALCGTERALVDASPGTTRDVVEAEVELGAAGLIRLLDTAGVRTGATPLEQRGHAIATARRLSATLVLHVYDGQVGFGAEDARLLDDVRAGGVPVMLVENKTDLVAGASAAGAVRVSARTGAGLDELRARLGHELGQGDEELAVASPRQAEALRNTSAQLDAAAEALVAGSPEVAAVALRRGLTALGQLTGETVDEEVLDALFARFCIGK